MRSIHPDLQARLDGGATTLCRCWRMRRRDGVVLGFTDHDGPLTFDGTVFRASSGLDATALQTSAGLSVDNAQVVGALSDAAISEEDLAAGRFDAAEVDHWLVDWQRPELRVHLFRGTLGEIKRTDTSFEAELAGLAEALNVPVGRTMKRTCDRVVGDRRCGVDLAAPQYRHETAVAAYSAEGVITMAAGGDFAAGWFSGGALRWTGGRNEGLTSVVRVDERVEDERVLRLSAAPPMPVAVGDKFTVTAGCDKHLDTCRMKFGNLLNFRGFPHIPGEDWVVAYPKNGEVHDGTSLQRG